VPHAEDEAGGEKMQAGQDRQHDRKRERSAYPFGKDSTE
jgi:hypothetical protein